MHYAFKSYLLITCLNSFSIFEMHVKIYPLNFIFFKEFLKNFNTKKSTQEYLQMQSNKLCPKRPPYGVKRTRASSTH